jgi:hypothetical protein
LRACTAQKLARLLTKPLAGETESLER